MATWQHHYEDGSTGHGNGLLHFDLQETNFRPAKITYLSSELSATA